MQWLPPNYRILYCKDLNWSLYEDNSKEVLVELLNQGVQQGSLFCCIENQPNVIIGMITDFNMENTQIEFLVKEKHPKSLQTYNVHLEKYEVMIDIMGHKIGNKIRIERISNMLQLKEIGEK